MSINEMLMAAAGSAGGDVNYIDDCFATHLYTGNGSTQTINNGIDLAGKGGLVWIKSRNNADGDHALTDTTRGRLSILRSNLTNAVSTASSGFNINSFNADGFTLGDSWVGYTNSSGSNLCSWTFRKQAKFMDVVTFTGDGNPGRQISHNLGSTPGMIIVKCTSNAAGWAVYHRGVANSYLVLNGTNANNPSVSQYYWGDDTSFIPPTSTVFTVGGANAGYGVNFSGATYVAYIFAHDAGGFGAAGTDNVISCGSYSGSGAAGNPITLGYEPQFMIVKRTNAIEPWLMYDVMRGQSLTEQLSLVPNASSAEFAQGGPIPTATGFNFASGDTAFNGSGSTYIYMAIRRPMKPPTSGTQVFAPIISSATTGTTLTTGFPVDLQLGALRAGDSDNFQTIDRLRGISTNSTENNGRYLITSLTNAERSTAASRSNFWDNTGFKMFTAWSGSSSLFYNFRRATGFMDVVCYTGTATYAKRNHNLGVSPELIINKRRDSTGNWDTWTSVVARPSNFGALNSTAAFSDANITVTSTQFDPLDDTSGATFVSYLFATLAGVSKVGSYTGNGSSQTINCGFTAGARFVMVKATSTTGDWVVVDTARGLVSGNDPFLELNTTAAEQTGQDILDPDSSGFVVNQTTESINASGVSYIFLAIA